jgi:hypothetical protein
MAFGTLEVGWIFEFGQLSPSFKKSLQAPELINLLTYFKFSFF